MLLAAIDTPPRCLFTAALRHTPPRRRLDAATTPCRRFIAAYHYLMLSFAFIFATLFQSADAMMISSSLLPIASCRDTICLCLMLRRHATPLRAATPLPD